VVKRVFLIGLHCEWRCFSLRLFKHVDDGRRIVLQSLQVFLLIVVGQVDLAHMNFKLLQDVFQFRRVVSRLSQTLHVLVENLAVLIDALTRVPVGVHGNEQRLQIEVIILLGCLNIIECFRHLLQRDWTHIWAVGKAKVDQIISVSEVFMCHFLALGVDERPGASNISFTCVSGWGLLVFFLAVDFGLLTSLVHHVREHKNSAECERANQQNKV